MSIFISADVHVGNHGGFGGTYKRGINWRGQRVLDILRQAAERAEGQPHVICGDLFNSHEPSPQVLARTIEAMRVNFESSPPSGDELKDRLEFMARGRSRRAPTLTCILKGNHDSNSPAPGDNALAPLCYVDEIEVLDEPCIFSFDPDPFEGLMMPFRPEEPSAWLPQAIDQAEVDYVGFNKTRVLFTHFGIAEESTPDYMRKGAMEVQELRALCIRKNIRYVFSGDWHSRKVWEFPEVTIVQVGALVPTGFNNPGLTGYGSLWELSAAGLVLHELPGPRFVRCTTLTQLRHYAEAWRGEWPAEATELFVSLVCGDERGEAEEYLNSLKDEGTIDNYVIDSNVDASVVAADAARAAAAKPQRFEEALHAAVQEQPPPAGISSDDVLARVDDLRRRAARG